MTTLKRKLLTSALAAAGLMLAGGVAQAAAPDVSSIFGRASPPNPQIMAPATAAYSTRGGMAAESSRDTVSDSAITQAYPAHASRTIYPYPGDGSKADSVADGTGRIHEQSLDGKPLVDGRGMRQGVDPYAAAPVQSEPQFDVADILGRASPPAPENAPDFGFRS